MSWGDKGGWHSNEGPWGRPPRAGGEPPEGGNLPPPGPDFDEWVRKGQDRLKQFLPDGGAGGGKGFILLGAIVVLLWLSSGIYFVGPDEQGVVTRFGAYHRTTSPGLNYHLPYPVESAATPKVTAVNRVEIGYRSGAVRSRGDNTIPEESLMLTGDENIIDINFEVQWKIDNAPHFLFNVRNPEDTVKAVAESAMREIIGQTAIATVLAEGKLQVEQSTKKLIQETLNEYAAGIEVVAVNLLKADPPAQVIDAFRDVQTARADMETTRNQADAYRNDIIPKARGQAEQMILGAEAYKQEVIARAQGESARFISVYEQFRQARDVTRKRIYLETMEEILQGMNKVIVDGRQTQGVLPYLPLPEIRNKSEAQP